MKCVKTCMLLTLSLLSGVVLALQEKAIESIDNKIVVAVSNKELNRVFVVEDKITHVKGDLEKVVLEEDSQNGQLFLMPREGGQSPFTLFVITQKGKTFQLRLVPKETQAETIKIVPPIEPEKIGTGLNHVYSDDDQTLGFMQKLMQGRAGEAARKLNVKKSWPKTSAALRVQQITLYQSKELEGIVLKVTNPHGDEDCKVHHKDFLHDEATIAVALQDEIVPAKTSRMVYVVKSRSKP